MPPKNLTIAALSQPRNRPPTQPQAPLTSAKKKEKQLASAETKAEMDAAVGTYYDVFSSPLDVFNTLETAEVQSYIKNKAVDLGKRFDKQPRYFLDIFYQAGARMVHAQEKTNPYNAFKSEKAAQARDGKSSVLNTSIIYLHVCRGSCIEGSRAPRRILG
jgi:hypothetical protein